MKKENSKINCLLAPKYEEFDQLNMHFTKGEDGLKTNSLQFIYQDLQKKIPKEFQNMFKLTNNIYDLFILEEKSIRDFNSFKNELKKSCFLKISSEIKVAREIHLDEFSFYRAICFAYLEILISEIEMNSNYLELIENLYSSKICLDEDHIKKKKD